MPKMGDRALLRKWRDSQRAAAAQGKGEALYLDTLRAILAAPSVLPAELKVLHKIQQQHHLTGEQVHKALVKAGATKDKLYEKIRPNQRTECVVCLEAVADHVIADCMHMCLCSACAVKFNPYGSQPVRGTFQQCPKCRGRIRNIKRVFM